jgi:hypothetical protein
MRPVMQVVKKDGTIEFDVEIDIDIEEDLDDIIFKNEEYAVSDK